MRTIYSTFVAAFALTVTAGGTAHAQQWCATIAGNWKDNYFYQWLLQQSSPSTITGTHTAPHYMCWYETWAVTGSRVGTGPTFTLTSTRPPFANPECAATVTHTITLNSPGCNTGQGSWTNSNGASGPITSWKKPCSAPGGESSSFLGWRDAFGFPTLSQWRGSLSGSENFGGRLVYEAGAGGTDTCWYSGSPFPAFTGVQGGTWSVNESNRYEPDVIGWRHDVVSHYRAAGRAPCSAQFPQTMKIRCNGVADIAYETHPVVVTITVTTVQVSRDGVTMQRIWP